MRKLLGLSLTANTVVWTLVDPVDGTIVAHDVVEVDSAEDVATAAAGSVEAFASQTERNVDAVRIAWSKGTAGAAVKLVPTLRSLGFSDIDLISEDDARHSRNRSARRIDPALELAYGAARTVTAEDQNRPLRRMTARLPTRRVSIAAASSVVVMAVTAAAAGYLLVDRAPPQAADHVSTPVASAPPPDDASVVAVPAAALPPPPAPEAAEAPPVVLALPPIEAAAPTVTEGAEVAIVPEAAGSTTVTETTALPDTAIAPGSAPATATAGQPHLSPNAPVAQPLPGPVPPMPVLGGPAPFAAPPPPPRPLGILAALP
jgi:hypothetical protein